MAREWYSRPINSGYTVVDGTTTGNYNNGVPNTYVKTWMEYKVLQDSTDISNNRSRIDVKLYSQVIDGGSSTGMSSAFTAGNYGYVGYDNANQSYLSTTYNYNNYALNKFADATLTVPHNADGTKSITLQGVFQTLSGTWAITGGSASASVTLPTIARGTELVSVANPYYGHDTYFTLSRKASNLREQVTMTSGSTTLTIKQTSTSDVNFYYELARSYTPNTTKPSASTWTISVKTYNGNTLVETKTYSQVFTIADGDEGSYRPLFNLSDITVQGYNDVVSSFGTNMVAGYSKMNVITAKSAIQLKYGATVASRVVTFQDGKTVSGIDDTNHISNKIMTAGNYSWRYVVVDSRGFSYEASGSSYVYGYSAPSIDVTECYRGDSSGNASTSGTYVWAKATASCTSVAGNSITAFKGQVAGFSAVNLTNGTRVQLTNNASVTSVYTVTFTVTDTAGTTTTVTRSIPSEDIPINIREGGKGVGIGAYANTVSTLEVGYKTHHTKGIELQETGDSNILRIDRFGYEMTSPVSGNDGYSNWANYSGGNLQQRTRLYESGVVTEDSQSVYSASYTRLTNTKNGKTIRGLFRPEAIYLEGSDGRDRITISGSGLAGTFMQVDDRYAITCNLIDQSLLEQGGISGTGEEFDVATRVRSGWTSVKANTAYTLSATPSTIRIMSFRYYNSSRASIGNYDVSSDVVTFTTPSNCAYIKVVFGNSTNTNVSPSDFSTLQLENGSSASPYVPYTMDGVEVAQFKQNKLGVTRVEFERTINANSDTNFTPSDIMTQAGLPNAKALIIIPEGVRPKTSWAEIHPVMFYNTLNGMWGVHNYGTGGVAIIDFVLVYDSYLY